MKYWARLLQIIFLFAILILQAACTSDNSSDNKITNFDTLPDSTSHHDSKDDNKARLSEDAANSSNEKESSSNDPIPNGNDPNFEEAEDKTEAMSFYNTSNGTIALDFPDTFQLDYTAAELEFLQQLDSSEEMKEWELEKTFSIGKINGNDVTIDLYANEEFSFFKGVLNHRDQSFLFERIGYSHDVEAIEQYPLNQTFKRENGEDVCLFSAIGSEAMGYQYLIQDNGIWKAIHDWGKPMILDMDNNGQKEIIMQFQGKGLNLPLASILKWENDYFYEVFIDAEEILGNDIIGLVSMSTIVKQNPPLLNLELFGNVATSVNYTFRDTQTISLLPLSKAEALTIARQLTQDQTDQMAWSAEFVQQFQLNPDQPEQTSDVWKVIARHPLGNQTIYYIDVNTGNPEVVTEVEAPASNQQS